MSIRKPPRTLAEYFSRKGSPTQEALAGQLGISGAYVSMIASGKRRPNLALAIRISAVTGIPIASLAVKVAA